MFTLLGLFGPPQAQRFGPDRWGEVVGRIELREDMPLDRARVRIDGTTIQTITTDDGRFHLPRVPSGAGVLLISHDTMPELGEKAYPIAVPRDAIASVGTLVLTHLGSLSGSGEVTGKVYLISNVPIGGANVSALLHQTSAITDPDGLFRLRPVLAGAQVLLISHPDMPYLDEYRYPVVVGRDQVSNVGILELTQPGSISGHVQGLSVEERARIVVTVLGLSVATRLDADGGYLLTGVAPGSRTVALLGARHRTKEIPIHHFPSEVITVEPHQVVMNVNFDYR